MLYLPQNDEVYHTTDPIDGIPLDKPSAPDFYRKPRTAIPASICLRTVSDASQCCTPFCTDRQTFRSPQMGAGAEGKGTEYSIRPSHPFAARQSLARQDATALYSLCRR